MKITVPGFSLVVLVGASGSGKSHFAQRHFKPTEVLSSDAFRGMVSDDPNDQAATKDAFEECRGREYLRIIYGPEYTAAGNLDRLRERGLSRKRSLAIREFALGIEALERFVRREPLRRIHECVFGVLAPESEPIDPRL